MIKQANTLASRLRKARAAKNMSQSAVAKHMKVSRGAVGQWEADITEPTRDNLSKLSTLLGVSYDWLATGRGHGPAEAEPVPGTAAEAPAAGTIQELDVRAGMGGGGVLDSQVRHDGSYVDAVREETWAFPSSFTRDALRAPASRLVIVEVQGDSMSPTLTPGERVVVDTGHKVPSPDGVYALRDRFDLVVVKRLQTRRDAPKIRIISDNPAHEDEEVGLEEITIMGRVVCALRLL